MTKTFKVTFYQSVVFTNDRDSEQDSFARFYSGEEGTLTKEDIAGIVKMELEEHKFIRNNHDHWYRTSLVSDFNIQEVEG